MNFFSEGVNGGNPAAEEKDQAACAKTERVMLYLLIGLVLVLPLDHTITLRAVLFVGCLLLWLNKIRLIGKVNVRRTPLDVPLLLYMVTIVISFFTSLKLSDSLEAFKGEFLTNTVLFYLVASNIDSEEKRGKIIAALLAGSAVMAVYGIVDFFLKGGSLLAVRYRAASLHHGYEAYAQYLIMVLPFNFLGMLSLKDGRWNIPLILLFMLNIGALYLTHTRAAWLACMVEMVIISSCIFSRRRGLVVASLLVLLSIAALYSLPEDVVWHGRKGLSTGEQNFTQNTGTERVVMWTVALKSLAEDPFTPAGYGKRAFRRKFPDRVFTYLEQAHNTFVNTAVQLGIQGLAALILLIGVILFMCWRGWTAETNGPGRRLQLGVFAMTIGFFTACQFAEFFIGDTARLFWILVGLAASLHGGRDFGERGVRSA